MRQRRPLDAGPPSGVEGFTLLELLIAIFIFAVVLSLVYTAYTGTLKNIGEVESRAEIYHMARIAMERMVEDLGSVYVSPREGAPKSEEDAPQPLRFVGEAKEIDSRRADTLRFASQAHLAFDEDGNGAATAEIVYSVGEGDAGDGLVLYRSDIPILMAGAGEETGGLMLCDGLYSIRFIYYDDQGEEYDHWDSSERTFQGRPPARVAIELAFVDPSEKAPLKFLTGVALPVGRGDGGAAAKR